MGTDRTNALAELGNFNLLSVQRSDAIQAISHKEKHISLEKQRYLLGGTWRLSVSWQYPGLTGMIERLAGRHFIYFAMNGEMFFFF